MRELVILVEELSAKRLLESVLPRLGLDLSIRCNVIPFRGKQDMGKQLTGKLRGYGNQQARFLVLRDQDSVPDCRILKAELLTKCRDAGKEAVTLVRIACHELETIYLADLAAVEKALGQKGLAKQQEVEKFRHPDRKPSPSNELMLLTKGAYQKVSGSRVIGQHLDLTNTRSPTFRNLLAGIRRLETELLTVPANRSHGAAPGAVWHGKIAYYWAALHTNENRITPNQKLQDVPRRPPHRHSADAGGGGRQWLGQIHAVRRVQLPARLPDVRRA